MTGMTGKIKVTTNSKVEFTPGVCTIKISSTPFPAVPVGNTSLYIQSQAYFPFKSANEGCSLDAKCNDHQSVEKDLIVLQKPSFSRITEAISLNPGIFGISIDIKKLYGLVSKSRFVLGFSGWVIRVFE